jgi:hypothetical protein
MNQEWSWNGREILGERVEKFAKGIVRGHILKELKRRLQNFRNKNDFKKDKEIFTEVPSRVKDLYVEFWGLELGVSDWGKYIFWRYLRTECCGDYYVFATKGQEQGAGENCVTRNFQISSPREVLLRQLNQGG